MLDPKEVSRLIKFLGMLGSSFAGERANAAEKANELIRGKGMTWEDLILGKMPSPSGRAAPAADQARRYASGREAREPVAIVVTIIHETPRAILVDTGTDTAWVPKSQILDQKPMASNPKAHIIGIPRWLADAKGINPWEDANA